MLPTELEVSGYCIRENQYSKSTVTFVLRDQLDPHLSVIDYGSADALGRILL